MDFISKMHDGSFSKQYERNDTLTPDFIKDAA